MSGNALRQVQVDGLELILLPFSIYGVIAFPSFARHIHPHDQEELELLPSIVLENVVDPVLGG